MLNPSRHGRDRHHHLAPTEEVDLPNSRTVRVGRTLCGFPTGPARVAAELCQECRQMAMDLHTYDPSVHDGTDEARTARATLPGGGWRDWQAEVMAKRSAVWTALRCWPKQKGVFRELLADRDMGPLVTPAPWSIVFATKARAKIFSILVDWGVLIVEPTLLGPRRAWRLAARPTSEAVIPPRDPRVEPWPGDSLVKGALTRLVVARPVDEESQGKPHRVGYRDQRGDDGSIQLATWARWSAEATVVDVAKRKQARLPVRMDE